MQAVYNTGMAFSSINGGKTSTAPLLTAHENGMRRKIISEYGLTEEKESCAVIAIDKGLLLTSGKQHTLSLRKTLPKSSAAMEPIPDSA